jgi:hypothetical protein
MRTRGRLRLARTGHPEAFEILSKNYAKPEAPKDHVKYMLVTILEENYADEPSVESWKKWREAYRSPGDAWLWNRSLVIHQDHRGDDDLLTIADDKKVDLFLRASALMALAENRSDNVLAWWEKKLDEADDWKGIERAVMLECAAYNYLAQAWQIKTDQFRNTGLKLIPLIDHKDTDPRTSLVMARCFRELFMTEKLWVNAAPWLNRLLNPDKPEATKDDKYGRSPPPTRFVGIEANGKRIVYVIDMSDSMCKPFTGKEKDEIKKPPPPKKGPVTGRGEGKKDGDKKDDKKDDKKGKKEEEPEEKSIEDEMPWDKIKTRWDAAREYLKLSLRSLQPDQSFCVICFGSEATTLKATKTMVPMSPHAIQAAIKELDSIKKGAGTDDRPDGILRGNTNMHGGLHRAFKVHLKGMLKENEYVAPETFFTGADTIFLLSDGRPSWDDWPANDKRDPKDSAGDPETGKRHTDTETLFFAGPYGMEYDHLFLPEDIRRLNLFRHCEIHCIGIGEATDSILYPIAAAGQGQVRMIGGGG